MFTRQDIRVYFATPYANYGTAKYIAQTLLITESQARYSLRKLKKYNLTESKRGYGWKATANSMDKFMKQKCVKKYFTTEKSYEEKYNEILKSFNDKAKQPTNIFNKIYNKLFK